ncbi:RNA binding protein, heterogenous nuclear RNP-K like protein, partial [Linderina macrospora]
MSDTESVDLYQISVARDGSDYHELLVDDNKARAKKENGDGADTQSQSASQAQDEEKLPNGQKSTKRPREGSAEPQEGAGNDVAGDDFQLHPDTLWSDDERDDTDHPAKRQAIGATGEGKSAAPAPARKRTGNTSAANAATTTAAAAAAALESFAVRTVVTRKDVDVIFEHEAGSKERLEQQKGVSISIIAGKDDPEIVVDRVVVVKGPIDGVCAAYLHIAEAMLEIKEAATRKREEDKKAGVSTEADAAADPHDHDADDSDDENKDDKDDDDNEKAAEASTGAEDATAPKAAEGEATAAPKAEKAEKTAKTEKTPAGPRLTLRILVPNRCIGIIMGHGGATINRIRDESGVNIRTSESMLPHSSERIVALIGAPPAIAKAIKLMAKVLVEDLANYSTNDYYVPAVNLPSAMTVNMSNRRTKPLNQRS